MRPLSLFASLSGLALLVACSGGAPAGAGASGSPGAGAEGGDGAPGGSSNGGDPGPGSGEPGGGDGDGGDDAIEGVGSIVATSMTFQAGDIVSRTTSVSAYFGKLAAASAGSCTSKTDGPCTIVDCLGNGDATIGTAGLTSFGKVSIGGGAIPVELVPTSGRYTPLSSTTDALFEGGETLTLGASGDATAATPSFARTLTAPAPVVVTSPAMSSSSTMEIDRASELSVAWAQGSSTPSVSVSLTGQSTGRTVSVSCLYTGSAGRGVVPATTLAALPVGDGAVAVQGTSRETFVLDRWRMTLQLIAPGRYGSGLASARTYFR